jgi:hypothetical protein
MAACLVLTCVTDSVVPVIVALAALEMVNEVALGMVLMVTVSGLDLVAVNVTPVAVAVAAVFNVKLVALLTDAATVSLAGIPGPEMAVPEDNETGVEVVTVVLPLVVEAANVVAVVVALGMPVPVMVIPRVSALVEAAVTAVLPLVVFALMVEVNPVRLIHGLPVLWQWTQNVGLVEASYALVPRLGVEEGTTPLMVTFDVSPSWL